MSGLQRFGSSVLLLLLMAFVLVGCNGKADDPESVATAFWEAVIKRDMETAKTLTHWESVSYLQYIQSGQLRPERFELGEAMIGKNRASIETTLHSQGTGSTGVRIPAKTVLINTEQGWRIDLKESIGNTFNKTVGTIFDQFNNLMKDGLQGLDNQLNESMKGGLQGLDKQLSESMKEVEKALKQGAEQLREELSKQPFGVPKGGSQILPPAEGQRI